MAEDIADDIAGDEVAPRKGSRLPLILGLILAILGGGGGFMAVQTGLIGVVSRAEAVPAQKEPAAAEPLPPIAFVPLDPFVISLAPSAESSHLRFNAQLEVDPAYTDEVAELKPRILDVLNGYLRAVAVEDLQDPAALSRLRAQMLRRVQVVVGEGRVRDLLIMEFVLN